MDAPTDYDDDEIGREYEARINRAVCAAIRPMLARAVHVAMAVGAVMYILVWIYAIHTTSDLRDQLSVNRTHAAAALARADQVHATAVSHADLQILRRDIDALRTSVHTAAEAWTETGKQIAQLEKSFAAHREWMRVDEQQRDQETELQAALLAELREARVRAERQ